ncbi:HAMP domain-containing histidine kinase, partial [archaeon]|nr:HAMP domain-containing histidine kinase [archaeon]
MNIELLFWVYHSINRFMATDDGELFKKFVELFLFAIVTYMIASEYGRTKESHLKYLLIGFGALAIDKLIMTLVYSFIVFGEVQTLMFNPFLPVLDLFLEIFALVLLTNAFIFPIFADKIGKLRKKIGREIIVVIIVVLAIEVFWYVVISLNPTAAFRTELSYLILELIKILILFGPIYYILCNYNKLGKYGPHIIIAFAVYMIAPIANVINVVFYGGLSNDLRVFANPFPFIAVLLFTRVIYLKLVDKATIKRELADTKEKYIHEQEVSKLKDEFVSTVSHELRTPLTSMGLYLSLLKNHKFGKLNSKQSGAVDIIKKESKRLANLINDVLSLSKLEAKKTKLRIEKVDLKKLIDNNLYYNYAEQKGIVINNKIPKNFHVKIDSEKFKQVFINLFSNATKYAKSKIHISASKHKDHWLFCVEDDGPGVPKEKIKKLFDKFYRVGDYLTKEQQGTGLGLSIVKNL